MTAGAELEKPLSPSAAESAAPAAARPPSKAAAGGWWGARAAARLRADADEYLAHACDAATAVLVVAVQDVAFKESLTACAVLSAVSLVASAHAARRGKRAVFPKAIEVMVPALCAALAAAAWAAEAATHRVVYVVICGGACLTMLATVLAGRSFALEYLMDWYPRAFWRTPLVRRLDRHLAWTWIAGQALMAAAAGVVVAAGDANAALYITCNYVLQLVPLAASVAATLIYPRNLKRRWAYDPSDPATGFPPHARSSAACLAAVAAAEAEADAEAASGVVGHGGGNGGGGGGDGGAAGINGRLGSRRALLGSWRQLAGWQAAGGSGTALEAAAHDEGGSSSSVADPNFHRRASAAAAAAAATGS